MNIYIYSHIYTYIYIYIYMYIYICHVRSRAALRVSTRPLPPPLPHPAAIQVHRTKVDRFLPQNRTVNFRIVCHPDCGRARPLSSKKWQM